MKNVSKLLLMLVAVFAVAFIYTGESVNAEESGCVSCHTSMRELIKVTREIAATKPQPEEEVESEGEG